MENNFHYAYNAEENQEVLNIRQKYLPQEQTDLQRLKALDAEVKRAPSTFAYIYGSISAIAAADASEMASLPGMSREAAENIKKHFQNVIVKTGK